MVSNAHSALNVRAGSALIGKIMEKTLAAHPLFALHRLSIIMDAARVSNASMMINVYLHPVYLDSVLSLAVIMMRRLLQTNAPS